MTNDPIMIFIGPVGSFVTCRRYVDQDKYRMTHFYWTQF